MDSLFLDLRHAVRRLWHAPGFTLVASLTLALGIGGNAAVLTALDALLLRPLPYADPERLVLVHQTDARQPHRAVAPANFLDWRERARSFEGLAAYEVVGRTLVESHAASRVDAGIASSNLFELLGANAALGRTFGAAQDGPREVVLGHALWRERFGADASVVGRELQLDQELARVVGVMPPGFGFPREAELWLRAKDDLPEIPIAVNVDLRMLRDSRYLGVVGRPARGHAARGRAGGDGHVAARARARVSRRELRQGRARRAAPRCAPRRSASGARAARRGGSPASCCRVRERGEPAAGARHGTAAGARGARRARRQPLAPRAPARGRGGRRRRRSAASPGSRSRGRAGR